MKIHVIQMKIYVFKLSKYLQPARTHDLRCTRHLSIAASMICPRQSRTKFA